MKRKLICLVGVMFATVLFAGCGECQHEWSEATCTEPKTCSKCGETDGVALGHNWEEATCTKPKTCKGCGKTEGGAKGHEVADWTVTKEATCTEKGEEQGTCSVCNTIIVQSLDLKEHTPGDWEVKTAATATSAGIRVQKCTVCGKEMDEESFTLSAAELKQQYIDQCATYTYAQIARNPEDYSGKYAKIKGEVVQVIEDGDDYTLLVDITRGRYIWEDTIMVSYTKQDSSENHILEDDIVMMYGQLRGSYTYETVMGADKTVPLLLAEYIDIQ